MSEDIDGLYSDHYDVALVGVWFGANYGSVLNGYAVYKLLKNMGLSVLMVNKINAKEDDGEINGTHNGEFIKKFYPKEDVSPCLPFEELNKLNKYCDTFMTGSDQIWHYNINSYFNLAMMLNFVDDEKRKISFGTSFGHAMDFTPPEKIEEVKNLMQRFNAISVREESGVELCRQIYRVKSRTIVEPVFCVEKQVFDEIVLKSTFNEEKPFILTYILDPTPEIRDLILYYGELTGKKVINILDGQPRTYEKNKKLLNLENMLTGIGTQDFLYLFSKADFIITDSFHGTSFSIIYNKPFLSIANKKRGYARFEDLLKRFGLFDRLVYDLSRFGKSEFFLTDIDYGNINKEIEKSKEDAINWLSYALFTPIKDMPTNMYPSKSITDKLDLKLCVGCGACVSVCPVNALTLRADEYGYYRTAIDLEKCIDCGACVSVCPAFCAPEKNNVVNPTCYAYQSNDEEVLEKSSSGGVFTALAEDTLKMGGMVVGAAWKDDFSVEHIMVDSVNDLKLLRKSKYLQSYMGDIYKSIKQKLDEDINVLFSGCPCQVAGLKSYLGEDYDNLVMVDILCSHSPSASFFQKYIKDSFPEGVSEYTFRYKNRDKEWDPGWRCDVVKVDTKLNEIKEIIGVKNDYFQRVYHNHTMCSSHCESCKFQEVPRYGDLTIGDFWGYEKRDTDLNVRKGVSVILCNNKKGLNFYDKVINDQVGISKKVPFDWIGGNGYAKKGSHNYSSPCRDAFYDAINKMPFSNAVNYALKPNHGYYRDIYINNLSFLNYDSKQLRFKFEPDYWEEHFVKGFTRLYVKKNAGPGHFATIPLFQCLEKDQQYVFSIRFRIKTVSKIINLHIKDSGSKMFQIIKSVNLVDKNDGIQWIEINSIFKPDADFYDEFMIGAAQLSGENNYIEFEYINISVDF